MIKKLLLAVAIIGAATYSQAQGFVNFDNSAVGVKIYDVDGTTPLSGNSYYAQIYAADGTLTSDATLTAKGTPVNFYSSTANKGYVKIGGTTTWDGSDVDPSVAVTSSTANSTVVTIEVRAWSADTTTTTYATATKSGKSTLFQVTALSATDSSTGLGQIPNNLTGLTSFSLSPEPTTIALGALGLSVLLFRRRK
jgi:hypothetical protein